MSKTSFRLVPPDALDRLGDRLHDAVGPIMRDRLEELGKVGESLIRGAAPVGPTGNYRSRVKATIDGHAPKLRLEVRSRARHFHFVEKGRRPGKMPPPARIAKVMGLPAQEAFLVARAIGKRGTRGKEVVNKVRPAFAREAQRAGKQMAKDLAKVAKAAGR